MIKIAKLKGLMAEKELTGVDIAKRLNITSRTFYQKLSKGVFTSTEMQALIDILEIEDPASVFFEPYTTKENRRKN